MQEACAAAYPLTTICYTADWQARYQPLWQQATQSAQRVEQVSPDVLAALATTVNPDGVVATAPRQLSSQVHQIDQIHQRSASAASSLQLGLLLETIQDPGNLGGMIRTAAAAGVDQIWVSADSVDIDHPKVLRASVGQWFRVSLQACDQPRAIAQQLKQQGIQIIATLPDAPLVYWETDLTVPTLLLMGNEGAGLSAELAQLADLQMRIPLKAGVESLNVAIAAALVLYEAQRQRTIASV